MFPSIYYQRYTINFPKYWLLRDEPSHTELLFHVSEDDYFSTLATVLRFYEESVNSKDISPEMRTLQIKTIKDVIENLLYLSKNYTIVSKDKK
jgi:hypothetical protein